MMSRLVGLDLDLGLVSHNSTDEDAERIGSNHGYYDHNIELG